MNKKKYYTGQFLIFVVLLLSQISLKVLHATQLPEKKPDQKIEDWNVVSESKECKQEESEKTYYDYLPSLGSGGILSAGSNWIGLGSRGMLSGSKNTPKDLSANMFDEIIKKIDCRSLDKKIIKQLLVKLHADIASRKKHSIILVVGPTRSGKSTIIGYFLGAELEKGKPNDHSQDKNSYDKEIVYIKDNKKEHLYPGIFHGSYSGTFQAELFPLKGKRDDYNCKLPFDYCDTEGTEGTKNRGENYSKIKHEKEIQAMSLLAPYLMLKMNKVKAILITVSKADLASKGGASFLHTTNFFVNYLQDYPYDSLKKHLFLAITQIDSDQLNRTLSRIGEKYNTNKKDQTKEEKENEKKEKDGEVDYFIGKQLSQVIGDFRDNVKLIANKFYREEPGNMTIARQKRLLEQFLLKGKIPRKNPRDVKVNSNKFLLINPMDGGIMRKRIEKIFKNIQGGIDGYKISSISNPLFDYIKEAIILPTISPICDYLEIEIEKQKEAVEQDNSVVPFKEYTYREENSYYDKSSLMKEIITSPWGFWSGVVGFVTGLGATIVTENPIVGWFAGVTTTTTMLGGRAGALWRLEKKFAYQGEFGPIARIEIDSDVNGGKVAFLAPKKEYIDKCFKKDNTDKNFIHMLKNFTINTENNEGEKQKERKVNRLIFGHQELATYQQERKEIAFSGLGIKKKSGLHIQYISGIKQHGYCRIQLFIRVKDHPATIKRKKEHIEKEGQKKLRQELERVTHDMWTLLATYRNFMFEEDLTTKKSVTECIRSYQKLINKEKKEKQQSLTTYNDERKEN